MVVYATTTTASNEWKQPPDQGQTWVQYQRRCGKSQVNLTQLQVTLSLWQSTLGSPRPSKLPSHLLRADKDSPSFQRSHNHLNPHGPKNFVGLFFPSQEYEKKNHCCMCANAPVHVGVLAHFYQFFSISGLDNYEFNVRVH